MVKKVINVLNKLARPESNYFGKYFDEADNVDLSLFESISQLTLTINPNKLKSKLLFFI